MLKFSRPDQIADPKPASKGALKPALYEPPASPARPASDVRLSPQPASHAPAATASAPPAPAAGDVGRAPALAGATEPGSRLLVGVNIKLKGVEISDCDGLVIEGHVEATIHSKAMEIAGPGTLTGTAMIDVAEVHGTFSGELTARTRLVVHGTGRVSGKIRYGKLVVAEGGELNGDVARLDAADGAAHAERVTAPGTAVGATATSGHSTAAHSSH
jgi:cytoskeletal protein CcmA (bactofilin family)